MARDFSRFYILKRVEEMRSRLAQIKSSVQHIGCDFRNICQSHSLRRTTPPILYPKKFLTNFMQLIDIVEQDIRTMEIDGGDFGRISRKLNKIDGNLGFILHLLTSLQSLHDQRISGLHTLTTIEFQPTLQSEYSLINKVYNAVDALSYELMWNIFGEEQVMKMKYVPLSSFGEAYTMLSPLRSIPGSLITIPYHDCFRARFWSGVAHEVAHSMTAHCKILNEPLYECASNELGALMDILFFNVKSSSLEKQVNAMHYASYQIDELTSDIISAYVCGPSSLFSAISMIGFPGRRRATFFESLQETSHPPIEVRANGMLSILKELDIPSIFPNLNEIMDGASLFLNSKNIISLDPDEDELYGEEAFEIDKTHFLPVIDDYNQMAVDFAIEIKKTLDGKMKPFDKSSWAESIKAINAGSLDKLSPIQLMNAAWLFRLNRNLDDSTLPVHMYLDNRKAESKFFETLVHQMYQFYSDKVVNMTSRYD